jgi:hypothetical protein
MKRNSQRGSAMLVSMILMAALLAGAAVLVSLQLASSRSTELTRTGISALYCAEAGLQASRATVVANQSAWGTNLGTGNEPSFLSGISHDIDGDNVADWTVRLEDNFDETSGNDIPGTDFDGKIYLVARCTKYPDTPREVRELLSYTTITNCYNAQRGGCGGNGNMN